MSGEYASLCLLSYNRPEFVNIAIRSAVANAGHPVELIVHDDGSDEGTRDLLHDLQDEGHISLLMLNAPGNNEGQGIALSRMFAAATGDPIVKLDHDLIFHPGWLAKCVSVLDANESRPDEPQIGALGLFKYEADPVRHDKMFIAAHDGWEEVADFVGSAMVIPRRAFDRFGPFSTRSVAFAEDNEFKLKISADPDWCCALYPTDLAVNQGFGPGPSTIVSQDGGQIVVTKIKPGPKVLNGAR